MKTQRILMALLIAALVLTACGDDASWLQLVGRWQDLESNALELEFTKGGQFTEYMYGQPTSHGEFYPQGQTLTLNYADCDPAKIHCSVRLGFTVTGDTLVIRDSQGDIRYRRSGTP